MIACPVEVITQKLCECFVVTGKPCPVGVVAKSLAVSLIDRKVGTILTMHPACSRQVRLKTARVKPVVCDA